MRLAWAASIVAQVLLLVALVRSGRRDWWTIYLGLDSALGIGLFPFHGTNAYYYGWTAGLVALMPFQFLAALESVGARSQWLTTWLLGATAIGGWVAALSPAAWPIPRQASMLLWAGSSLFCLAVLLSSRVTDKWMASYYIIQSALSLLIQVSHLQSWAVQVGILQSVLLTLLFLWWAISVQCKRRIIDNGG